MAQVSINMVVAVFFTLTLPVASPEHLHDDFLLQSLHDFLLETVREAKNSTSMNSLSLQSVETAKGMLFAGCDACDCDVCAMVTNDGDFAPVETRIFEHILLTEAGCSHVDGQPGLVIDVGAKAGYFSTHAATMGCNVVAFEPNPGAAAFLQLNAAINHLQNHVQHYGMAVGATSGSAVMKKDVDWGHQGVQPVADGSVQDGQNVLRIVPLGEVVEQDAVLMKIDVEGFEDKVFEGAMQYLQSHNVANIVVEVKVLMTRKDLLKRVMEAARMQYAYSYPEEYGQTLRNVTDLVGRITDVTAALDDSTQLYCEDIWLRQEKLPQEFMITEGSDLACMELA